MPCLADPGYEPTLFERIFGADVDTTVRTTGYPIMEAVGRTMRNLFVAATAALTVGSCVVVYTGPPPESPTDTDAQGKLLASTKRSGVLSDKNTGPDISTSTVPRRGSGPSGV